MQPSKIKIKIVSVQPTVDMKLQLRYVYIHDYAVILALFLSEHNEMLQGMLCLWVGLPHIPI
jgi:hypothetical protein